MSLKVYNSQSKKLEDFIPITPGIVKMYVCGPTVYNFLHVGNFRGVVFFNLVRNWLEKSGYRVQYALNFTDVDDKIIQRASEMGVTPHELSEKYIEEYKKDFAALGLRPHDFNPKVTDHMDGIRSMVGDLIAKGKAYEVQGDVMYSIESFPGYGKLSGRHVEELQAGARVEIDEKKKNPSDFALWKAAKGGEISWPSPWGAGRPGWHIECSAMIHQIFGEQIDIHGGGMDLMFPHHENEIAQSEGCSGNSFVKYWMHNNMLNFGGQKMSKSLGNIVTMREFLEVNSAELYKWMMLSVHYRTLSDFSDSAMEKATGGLARIYSSLALAESFISEEYTRDVKFEEMISESWIKIKNALDDDFSTPEAFAILFDVVRQFNSQVRRGMKPNSAIAGKALAFQKFVKDFGALMSLFQESAHDFLIRLDDLLLKKMNLNRKEINLLVVERSNARDLKDFVRSDELRLKLTSMGIAVSDTSQGSFWEVMK